MIPRGASGASEEPDLAGAILEESPAHWHALRVKLMEEAAGVSLRTGGYTMDKRALQES